MDADPAQRPTLQPLPAKGFRSLRTRLIFWTLLLGGGTTCLTLVLTSRVSQDSAVRASKREAIRAREVAASRIEQVLHAIEEGTRVLAVTLQTTKPTDAELEALLKRFVRGNSSIFGSAAAFAPKVFDVRRDHFAPYVFRSYSSASSVLARADLASDAYRYWESDWYAEPARTKQARWSEPYFDEGGGNVTMVTYSVPVLGPAPEGSPLRAVVTADVHLGWLVRLAREIRVGRSGFVLILSREGRVLAHPDLPSTGYSFVEQMDPKFRTRIAPLAERMRSGRSGFEPLALDDGSYRVTYGPIGTAGWSLAAAYPERELMEDATRLIALQVGLGAAGIALLAFILVLLSRRLTAPLRDLGVKARELAAGNLDLALPDVRTRDEIGALTAAFHHMRESLKVYIRDLQEATATRERLESELRLARRIQMAMLPTGAAGGAAQGYALAARLLPARAVGGDLFDHFVRDGKLHFLVADVSGKGVPAALFMARAKTLFESASSIENDPSSIMRRVNVGLCRENEAGMFVTGVCGILDSATGDLALAVAGHDPPLLARSGPPVVPLEVEGGTVLGVMEQAEFPLNRIHLEPGELVVAYTDGVTDARDESETFFGPERLVQAVAEAAPGGATTVAETVLEVVQAFAGRADQADDITILAVQHRPS